MTSLSFLPASIKKNNIIIALAVVASLLIAWQLRYLIITLFLSFVFTAAFLPLVNRLDSSMPRSIAAAIPILAFIMLFVVLIIPISTITLEQTQGFADQVKTLFADIQHLLPDSLIPQNVANLLTVPQQIASVVISIFLMLYAAYYFLLDHNKACTLFARLFPKEKRKEVIDRLLYVENRLGKWVRGQVIVAVVVGFASFIAYALIGLPFAISLAYLAMLLELIPTLGPTLALIPAILIAFTISPIAVLYTVIAFGIIQILESYLLVPKVMEKVIGLHPVIIVFSLIIGSTFFGIVGALVAVPVAATMSALFQYEADYGVNNS